MGTTAQPTNTPEPKVHFKNKAEWAAAQATQLRETASQLRYENSKGSSIKSRQKFECIANLNREAARYESMARHYREQGL